jgi:hypothetical protein
MRKLMTVVLAAAVAACGGGGGDDTPTGTTPTLNLALSGSALSVVQGASNTVTATITRGGGLTANVDLSIEGAPTGVTASFNPASLSSSVTSSTLTITAAAGAAAGTTSLTVRAKSTGVSDQTATLALTVTAASAGGFTLSASPASGTLVQGTAGVVTINVARTAPFTGAVALTVSGAPTGVTTVLSPTSVTGTTSTLSTSVSATAAPGTYNLVVAGTAAGVANQSTTVILVVSAAATGGFSLAASPVGASIVQGTSGTSTITVTRTAPFTGAVALAVSGAPTGVTATLNPASVTGTTSTLTIAAAATTAPGTYSLTITGTGTGVSGATTTVSFTVAQASTGSGNVTWTFCASNAPIWLAAQDGAGTWTRVTPGSNNDFKFTINGANGGVAWVTTTSSGSFTLNISYGTQAELLGQGVGQCPGGATKTFTGTVAGLTSGDVATIALGGASASATANGPFTLNNVPSGLQDLLASDAAQTFNGTTLVTQVKKIILRRNLNLATGAVLPTLDFGASEAFAPGTATVTLANGGSDLLTSSAAYFTANGSAGGFSTDLSSSATRTYYGIPAAQQAAGDLHSLIASAIVVNGVAASQVRNATVFFKDLANKTLTFGPTPNSPTITTAATTPVARLRAQLAIQAEYNKSFVLSYSQAVGSTSRSVVIQISSGYLGANPTTLDITMPDLSGVAGWDNNWGLRTGTSTSWFTSASGWTFTGTLTSPVDAGVILSGTKLGTITP